MTVLTGANVGVYTGDPVNYWAFYDAEALGSVTSTSFSVQNPVSNERWDFTGSGFGGLVDGVPTTGTVTGVNYYRNGELLVSITGASASLFTLLAHLATGNIAAIAPLLFSGADTFNGSTGDDFMEGGGGNDTLLGGAGNDRLVGDAGVNVIRGEAGDDVLISRGSGDTVDGGDGLDTVSLSILAPEGSTLDVADFASADGVVLANGTTVRNIERFGISSMTNSLTLIAGPFTGTNEFYGGGSNDRAVVDMSAMTTGIAMFSPHPDYAQINTADGSLTLGRVEVLELTGGSGNDIFFGAAGDDILRGSAGDDQLASGLGDDTLDGGAGNDTLIDSDGLYFVAPGDDTLDGGDGDDYLRGGGGTNILRGGAGNDTIRSGGDSLDPVASVDVIDGGDGIDGLNLVLTDTTGQTLDWTLASSDTGTVLANGTSIRNMETFQIYMGSGNDTFIIGGTLQGYNFLNGGAGTDRLIADFSAETRSINLTALGGDIRIGDATLYYGMEILEIVGGSGDDALQGGNGDDVLSGGAGNDSFTIGYGYDQLRGGDGDDVFRNGYYAPVQQVDIDGGAGQDYVDLDLRGYTEAFSIIVHAGAAAAGPGVIANVEGGRIRTGLGDDTLGYVGLPSGNFFLEGGEGVDRLLLDFRNAVEGAVFNPYGMTVSETQSTRFTGFETFGIVSGGGADTLTGGNLDDTLSGGAGDDLLQGGLGADTLDGGLGADTLDGGDGLDTASFASETAAVFAHLGWGYAAGSAFLGAGAADIGADTLLAIEALTGGSGNDILIAGDLAATLEGGAGGDWAEGGAGDDTVGGGSGNDAVLGGLGADTLHGGDGDDGVIGGTGNDTLNGDAGIDWIYGEDGDDVAHGGDDTDIMIGGAGNDILNGDAGNDAIIGETGADTLNGGEGDDWIEGGAGADQLTGGAGADALIGQDGDDTGHGGAGNDGMSGGAGADTLNGDDGDDYITGEDGDDTLNGGGGNDGLFGGAGANVYHGGDGDDGLIGGGDAETMNGDAGNDWIQGWGGADQLTGGAGADVFVYSTNTDSPTTAMDRILDFNRAEGDIVKLDLMDADWIAGGDQAFTIVGAFSNQASQMTAVYNAGTNITLLSFDMNGDGLADMAIEVTGNATAADNFIL